MRLLLEAMVNAGLLFNTLPDQIGANVSLKKSIETFVGLQTPI